MSTRSVSHSRNGKISTDLALAGARRDSQTWLACWAEAAAGAYPHLLNFSGEGRFALIPDGATTQQRNIAAPAVFVYNPAMPSRDQLAEFTTWCAKHITGDEKGEAQIFLDHS